MALKLIYKDIALGAAEDASTTVTDAETFSAPSELPYGVSTGAIATCERNAWGLSHDYKVKASQPFALWSRSVTGNNSAFSRPPQITLDFGAQYTSTGLTFRFSPGANEWCSQIRVLWYQNNAIKENGTYYPTAPLYTLENTVEAFDKVEIFLDKTSLPNRRAKLEYIGIGVVREIDAQELTGAKIIHEIDLASETVPVNVIDAEFHSETDTDYIFQKKQPVEAYDADNLIGVYYIEKGTRTGARDYSISCQDAIGALDLDEFAGGFWWELTPIGEILTTILGGSFELEISAEAAEKTLKGHIPKCKKREAMQQVAFAAGVCVDTTGSTKIKVFVPPTGEGAEIQAAETYTGGKVDTSDVVTAVSVLGWNIQDARPSENDEYIEFEKVQYRCSSAEYVAENPNVTVGTLPNKISYEDCYLISKEQAQERADALLAHHMRRNVYTAAHVLRDQKPGGRYKVSLPWGGEENAHIRKMQITMSGINASETEFLLD